MKVYENGFVVLFIILKILLFFCNFIYFVSPSKYIVLVLSSHRTFSYQIIVSRRQRSLLIFISSAPVFTWFSGSSF